MGRGPSDIAGSMKPTPQKFLVVLFLIASPILLAEKQVMLDSKKMAQVGIVVPDIRKAAEAYARFFGVDTPDIIQADSPADNPTTYRGKRTEGSCYLAFFNLENIQLELIEPIGKNSTWHEFLAKTGGGIHHIAFWIKGMDGQVKQLQMMGLQEVQHGGWDGGQYSYLETPAEMGILIELLENFNE